MGEGGAMAHKGPSIYGERSGTEYGLGLAVANAPTATGRADGLKPLQLAQPTTLDVAGQAGLTYSGPIWVVGHKARDPPFRPFSSLSIGSASSNGQRGLGGNFPSPPSGEAHMGDGPVGQDFHAHDWGSPSPEHPLDFESNAVGHSQDGSFFNAHVTPVLPRQRRMRVLPQVTQLNDCLGSEFSETNDQEVDEGLQEGVPNTNMYGIKVLYRDETWTQNYCTYNPPMVEFLGRRGNTKFFENFSTILILWNLFWPHTLLQEIVRETNCYATAILDAMGSYMEVQIGSH